MLVADSEQAHRFVQGVKSNELRPFLQAHADNGDQAGAALLAVSAHAYLAGEPELSSMGEAVPRTWPRQTK